MLVLEEVKNPEEEPLEVIIILVTI